MSEFLFAQIHSLKRRPALNPTRAVSRVFTVHASNRDGIAHKEQPAAVTPIGVPEGEIEQLACWVNLCFGTDGENRGQLCDSGTENPRIRESILADD